MISVAKRICNKAAYLVCVGMGMNVCNVTPASVYPIAMAALSASRCSGVFLTKTSTGVMRGIVISE